MKSKLIALFLLFFSIFPVHARFVLTAGETVSVGMVMSEEPVVHTALSILAKDLQSVLSASVRQDPEESRILIGTIGHDTPAERAGIDLTPLEGKKEAFLLHVLPDGRLLIAGSDSHGTAYGILELSRLLGVSPWEWWADVTPAPRKSFKLPAGYQTLQAPDVEYRGIFINDEDWGLMPWSSLTYEPGGKYGTIGPRTHERIFELLLRLRANTYWPAMHECTVPFFLTEGNRETAKRFGIYIGSSHCEPMACSTPKEWPARGQGEYDYMHNAPAVSRFWEDRVKEVAGQEILYTLGMRGLHDGQMQGAKTVEEQKGILERVIDDQRRLLARHVNPDVTAVPQVFIPYKEVLDIYRAGLEVPEEVILMWCDDNYGYIRHFPTAEEQARKGGNGIYYHISYWGRPHDYLWLGTFSPALLYQQMATAYERGIQKMWILNVGDIKPAEYQIELFMDMAWDMDKVRTEGITRHLKHFLQREFGAKTGSKLLPVMQEHYRLAYQRKPEFMGNTRVEEYHTDRYKIVTDLPWSRQTMDRRIEAYRQISDAVEELAGRIPGSRQDAYYQLVKYPVQGAAEMNKKMLLAQLARHGEGAWEESRTAFDSIATLTRIYNHGIHNRGKWNRIMYHQPRKLPVFDPVKQSSAHTPIPDEPQGQKVWNGSEYARGNATPCEQLGYEGKAVAIAKGEEVVFDFSLPKADSMEVRIHLLPNHPIEGPQLRISVALNREQPRIVSYETYGRSEEWKENVLRNQAVCTLRIPMRKKGKQALHIGAIDEGVVLDQLRIIPVSEP